MTQVERSEAAGPVEDAAEQQLDRGRVLGEVLLVAALSLGRSGVYAVVQLIGLLVQITSVTTSGKQRCEDPIGERGNRQWRQQ